MRDVNKVFADRLSESDINNLIFVLFCLYREMSVVGEAVGRRQREENAQTSHNLFKSSAATIEPTVSEDAVLGIA